MKEWVQVNMVADGYINPNDLNIFKIVDTAEEAFEIVSKTQEKIL
jgi:predicted Rossmann-fold nucleotide-binding protein